MIDYDSGEYVKGPIYTWPKEECTGDESLDFEENRGDDSLTLRPGTVLPQKSSPALDGPGLPFNTLESHNGGAE